MRAFLLLGLLCPLVAFGQATPALSKCFGKDFPAYEAVLKKLPERNLNSLTEDRIYRGKRNGCVVLSKEKGAKVVTTVSVLFSKGQIGWRKALRSIGVGTDHAHLVNKPGYYIITGCKQIPHGWLIWWVKDLDGTGQHELSLGVSHPRVR